jgi:NDP-sugar pyrophosphorylase family protein
MDNYKLFIPSAGLGTRLGHLSNNINKALVTIDNKPVISHVIEKFSPDIEIVIALGFKGGLVRDYLNLAHPKRNFVFVFIDKFEGPESGLGYSILQCRQHLQCPFIFCPNDTIIIENIDPPTKNWIGYADLKNNNSYRSLKIDEYGLVQKIYEKSEVYDPESKPYTGLFGVKSYNQFWNIMEQGKKYGSIKIGESYAIREFIKNNIPIEAKKVSWLDTGTPDRLKKSREILRSENSPEILEKENESIWFVGDQVIKYNRDKNFILDRVKRSKILNGYVPPVLAYNENMYSYRFIEGSVLSKINTPRIFSKFLKYLKGFWNPYILDEKESKEFKQVCYQFYKEKTEKRVKLYFDKMSEIDTSSIINDENIPKVSDLLNKIDWNWLSAGNPTRVHGDLHFENAVLAENGEFYLLDWRQNFGGIKEYGDVYYDLAKILHGLEVSHELINKNHFSVCKNNNITRFDLYRKYSLVENEKMFMDFLKMNNFDMQKVRILTSLIYLNIAPLHHYPYNLLLFHLGKLNLYTLLKEKV